MDLRGKAFHIATGNPVRQEHSAHNVQWHMVAVLHEKSMSDVRMFLTEGTATGWRPTIGRYSRIIGIKKTEETRKVKRLRRTASVSIRRCCESFVTSHRRCTIAGSAVWRFDPVDWRR